MRRLMLAVLLVLTGCGAGTENGVGFTAIDLTATPEALAPHGDALLVGTRPSDHPELVLRAKDGTQSNVRLTPATPYGREAHWYGLTSNGREIHGVGGERGGAHGNVRWSAWTGDSRQVVEKTQGFSTFGGYGAGELNTVVGTANGPLIIGSWQSDKVGLDVATWTYAADTWTRQPSAGTPLESSNEALKFPIAATSTGNGGAIVVGWQVGGGNTSAVVWEFDGKAWTTTTLPEGEAALNVGCWDGTCHVVGRGKGKLVWWRSGPWTRVETPEVPVSDQDDLAPPVPVNGRPTLFVDHGGVKLVSEKDERPADGPSGKVVTAAVSGGQVFVIAGNRLWRLT